jgi:hypothetical protein
VVVMVVADCFRAGLDCGSRLDGLCLCVAAL